MKPLYKMISVEYLHLGWGGGQSAPAVSLDLITTRTAKIPADKGRGSTYLRDCLGVKTITLAINLKSRCQENKLHEQRMLRVE